ncbi:unnamed protein product [Arctogadus glacialis]
MFTVSVAPSLTPVPGSSEEWDVILRKHTLGEGAVINTGGKHTKTRHTMTDFTQINDPMMFAEHIQQQSMVFIYSTL